MTAVADPLTESQSLVDEGRYLDAIATLTAANRERRDPQIESRLVQLRHQAWNEVAGQEPVGPWPPHPPGELVPGDLPDIAFADLTPEALSEAVFGHGGVIVRGLLPPALIELLNADIDETMETVQRFVDAGGGTDAPEWFTPFDAPGYDLGGVGRFWVLKNGTVWTADSPRTLFDLLGSLDDVGLGDLLTRFFGRRPVLSVMKCALRRTPPDAVGAWHQDGYVAGGETRALNVWIATSRCGDVAPGLDVLPRRLDHMVETAAEPPFDFCVSDELVAGLAEQTPVASPVFEPGDAMMFDQFLLHQTGRGPDFTRDRYGFECWFFDPATFPTRFVPLVY